MIAGIELRKERRLSEVLTDSFNILFAHWRQLIFIAVPLLVVSIAFGLLTISLTPEWLDSEEFRDGTRELTEDDIGDFIPLMVLLALYVPVVIVVSQLVAAASVVFLDETDRGNTLTPSEALDRAQANLGALLGATLRASLIIVLLSITIVGIPFAINRSIRWIFISQVVMLEGKRSQEVLRTSSDIVKGRWWNTLGRLIVAGLVVGIPVGILSEALSQAMPGVAGTIVSSATVFITTSYSIISLSLMYFDLKARKSANDSFSPDRESLTQPEPPGQSPGYL